jgi:hypothetical protein
MSEEQEIEEKWIQFKEETNALDYLRRACTFIRETEDQPRSWKWVMIGLHGALYGFAVSACQHTSTENVTNDRDYLIGFWDALERCQDPEWMNVLTHSQHLELTEEQEEAIRKMKNMLRNNFEHFTPKVWYIEIHGMPEVSIHVLEVIQFLAVETQTYVMLRKEKKEEVNKLVDNTIRFLKSTDLYKEAKEIDRKAKDESA